MPYPRISKNKYKKIPGIIVECKSGRYLAFYDHRTDIVANGNSEREVKKNLKEMYETVLEHEKEESEKSENELPEDFKTKKFKEKTLTH